MASVQKAYGMIGCCFQLSRRHKKQIVKILSKEKHPAIIPAMAGCFGPQTEKNPIMAATGA